jgi:hypothetical protein
MLQTVVVVILLLIDAAVVLANPPALQTSLTLRVPGAGAGQATVVTAQMLMIAAGIALVLGWIASLIDRAALDRRVQQYERTVRVMSDEMLRVKARAYDEERQPLEDIRVRLDTLDRDIRGLRVRLDREPLARPAETTRVALDKPA